MIGNQDWRHGLDMGAKLVGREQQQVVVGRLVTAGKRGSTCKRPSHYVRR